MVPTRHRGYKVSNVAQREIMYGRLYWLAFVVSHYLFGRLRLRCLYWYLNVFYLKIRMHAQCIFLDSPLTTFQLQQVMRSECSFRTLWIPAPVHQFFVTFWGAFIWYFSIIIGALSLLSKDFHLGGALPCCRFAMAKGDYKDTVLTGALNLSCMACNVLLPDANLIMRSSTHRIKLLRATGDARRDWDNA